MRSVRKKKKRKRKRMQKAYRGNRGRREAYERGRNGRLMSLLRGSFHALSSRSSSKLTQKARDYFHDAWPQAFREHP